MEVKFSWGNIKSNMFSFIKWYLQIKNENLKKTSFNYDKTAKLSTVFQNLIKKIKQYILIVFL